MRQYSAFAGIVFGQKTRKFFAKLEPLGWVSTYDCAHNRGRMYHLRHRELYDAIGNPESRLRRPPAVPRALERLLDAILKDPDVVWLATPDEKVSHVSMLTRVQPDAMPQVRAPRGCPEPVLYFHRQPAHGVHPAGRWILMCLIPQDAHRELRGFLERHLLLLAGLPAWTLRIAIPAHIATYATPLVDEVKHALRYRVGGQIADDLR